MVSRKAFLMVLGQGREQNLRRASDFSSPLSQPLNGKFVCDLSVPASEGDLLPVEFRIETLFKIK